VIFRRKSPFSNSSKKLDKAAEVKNVFPSFLSPRSPGRRGMVEILRSVKKKIVAD
jgi:hypothetical protein